MHIDLVSLLLLNDLILLESQYIVIEDVTVFREDLIIEPSTLAVKDLQVLRHGSRVLQLKFAIFTTTAQAKFSCRVGSCLTYSIDNSSIFLLFFFFFDHYNVIISSIDWRDWRGKLVATTTYSSLQSSLIWGGALIFCWSGSSSSSSITLSCWWRRRFNHFGFSFIFHFLVTLCKLIVRVVTVVSPLVGLLLLLEILFGLLLGSLKLFSASVLLFNGFWTFTFRASTHWSDMESHVIKDVAVLVILQFTAVQLISLASFISRGTNRLLAEGALARDMYRRRNRRLWWQLWVYSSSLTSEIQFSLLLLLSKLCCFLCRATSRLLRTAKAWLRRAKLISLWPLISAAITTGSWLLLLLLLCLSLLQEIPVFVLKTISTKIASADILFLQIPCVDAVHMDLSLAAGCTHYTRISSGL